MSKEAEELEYKWNADVIDFWSATLDNYKTCHDQVEPIGDPQKVTDTLLEKLDSIKATKEFSVAGTIEQELKREEPQQDSKEVDRLDHITQRKEHEEDNGDEEEEEEEEEEVYEEEEEEEAYDEEEQEEDEYEEEEQSRHSKKRKTNDNSYQDDYYGQYYSQAPQSAPVPPMMSGNDEGLSNLIMAWYYAGYYTGLYQAQRR